MIHSTMASARSIESTLPTVYESYDAIAPTKYAGKLQGKVVRQRCFKQLSTKTNSQPRS
jgi:hypothetical protein